MKLPDALTVSPHVEYRIPNYDLEAFLIEAELLLDWFMPRFGVEVQPAEREQFRELWRALLQPALDMPPTWVLRDFHSPNLLWLPKRSGLARLGILDFQDALMGPAAYDLASLLQDARIDVPEQAEVAWLGRYVLTRREKDPNFDHTQFIKIYVTLAAQRASKILGIFDPPRPARWEAAIFPSSSAHMGLPATFAQSSGAQAAQGLVRRQCAIVKDNLRSA